MYFKRVSFYTTLFPSCRVAENACSKFQWGFYEIFQYEQCILYIHHKASMLIASKCNIFNYTLHVFSRMRASLLQIEHICQNLGVDVKWCCTCIDVLVDVTIDFDFSYLKYDNVKFDIRILN